MDLDFINTGTASVDAGGTVVSGQNTAWSLQCTAGDFFGGHVGLQVRIATVDSDTQVTLAYPWPGAAQTAGAYEIRASADTERYQETTRRLFNVLSTGAFFDPDAEGTLAGRDAYDDKKKGFKYLDLEASELYYKLSDASGDWAGPFAYARGEQGPQGIKGNTGETGPVGPANSLSIGTVESGIAPDASITGEAPAQTLNLTLQRGPQGPQGDRGVAWRGAWDSGTTYAAFDVVIADDGDGQPAAWIALEATTGDDPQASPTKWAFFPGSFPSTVNDGHWGDASTESVNDGIWAA